MFPEKAVFTEEILVKLQETLLKLHGRSIEPFKLIKCMYLVFLCANEICYVYLSFMIAFNYE